VDAIPTVPPETREDRQREIALAVRNDDAKPLFRSSWAIEQ